MEEHREDRRKEINLTGWWVVIAIVVVIIGGEKFLSEVVLVDRLTLHNATNDPIVFAGARGESGNVRQADVFVDSCETAEFEWGVIGWTSNEPDAFEPIVNAVRVEMTIRPPPDGVAGASYAAVVTNQGVREVDEDERSPACAG